jgi:hypothetical protein
VVACDPAETCSGSSATCPAEFPILDGDGDQVCDARDLCPTTSNTDQADGDGDNRGDACDPCTNLHGVQVTRPLVSMRTTRARGTRLKITGEMTLPHPFSPPLAPLANGVRILLDDARGGNLVDAMLPGGAGWATVKGGTGWVYRNNGKGTPLIDGITKVVVKDLSARFSGVIRFTIIGRLPTLALESTDLPLKAAIVLDPPNATTGLCAETAFASETACFLNGRASSLQCR